MYDTLNFLIQLSSSILLFSIVIIIIIIIFHYLPTVQSVFSRSGKVCIGQDNYLVIKFSLLY